jgi:hypothetical protein
MARSPKTQYRRSTPVIRLQRNVLKLERHAALVNSRLLSWVVEDDESLADQVRLAGAIIQNIARLKTEVDTLVTSRFVPPRRSSALVYIEGQMVAVAAKHRDKYETAFEKVLKEDPGFLDELVVVKVLSSGEITVRRGQRTPFIVRKSHLVAV